MADGSQGDPVIAALSAGLPASSPPSTSSKGAPPDPVVAALSAPAASPMRTSGTGTLPGSNPAEGSDVFTEGVGKAFVDTGRGIHQIALHIGNHLGLVSDQDVAAYDASMRPRLEAAEDSRGQNPF